MIRKDQICRRCIPFFLFLSGSDFKMLCSRCGRPSILWGVGCAPGWRPPHLRHHPEGAGPQARAPDRPHRHLGPARVPRHRLHPAHLRVLGVLRLNGQHWGPCRVPAHHDGELHLPGVRQVRHWTQARLSPRSKVSTSLKYQRAEKTLGSSSSKIGI